MLARLHLLEGLLIAYLNIDEVIAIIRQEDEPKPVLMQRFSLSDRQAEAVLELKLRYLARLEEVKIRAEQKTLEQERKALKRTLASKKRLHTLIQDEIREDAEKHGDARKSPIVRRTAARALDTSSLIASEPTTIVLSEKGWVRAAKGHDIDPGGLAFRAGDAYRGSAQGRSNQPVYFFDSTGRVYTLPAHDLPSARSQGEPLTGRLRPPAGAQFIGVLAGSLDDVYLVASDGGFGFLASLSDMNTKNRAGKSILTLPAGAQPLAPARIDQKETDRLAVITVQGRLLIFPVSEVPELNRGKGNKLIQIASNQAKTREDYVVGMVSLPLGASLRILSGKRHLTLKQDDLNSYSGSRALRGRLLPRGFQRVERLEAV